MALSHSTAARNADTDSVTNLLGTSPKIVFRTAGSLGAPGTAVATLTMSATAFGAASNGVASANAITSDTNATGNASAVTTASIEKADGTIIIHCSVTGSGGGGDIILTNGTTIASGDTVALSSLTFQALPA